jgi:hypothetical protein
MASLLSVVASGQDAIVSAEQQALQDELTVFATTITDPDERAGLKTSIAAYLPVLEGRIANLSRQINAVGEAYTQTLTKQQELQSTLNDTTKSNFVSNIYKATAAYLGATGAQLTDWSAKNDLKISELNASVTATGAKLYGLLVNSDNHVRAQGTQVDFYNKYTAHLQTVQTGLQADLVFLRDSRDMLAMLYPLL